MDDDRAEGDERRRRGGRLRVGDTGRRGGSSGANYLDVPGASALLGVDECFVRRLVWERRIPYYKVGKYVRFDRAEVLEWVESNRVAPLR
jgi:excisionase family DNA binding protein